jgi:hypothetical protein
MKLILAEVGQRQLLASDNVSNLLRGGHPHHVNGASGPTPGIRTTINGR